tara:strand:+ start:380 stop:703 length:324 start_codon:yes stop_codon:yes gene_type:complete
MSYLKIIAVLILIIFCSSCGSVKKALTNQKKNSSDEFLVEKKTPLTMPPDYNELPIPEQNGSKNQTNGTKIEELITNSQGSDGDRKNNTNNDGQNFEQKILQKIKKN